MPSLSELNQVYQSPLQQMNNAQSQGIGLEQAASNARSQRIQNQQALAELKDYQEGQSLRRLNRQLSEMDTKFQMSPEYRRLYEADTLGTMGNKLSETNKTSMQNSLDMWDSVKGSMEAGNTSELKDNIRAMIQSPEGQALLQNPKQRQLLMGVAQGNPKAIAAYDRLMSVTRAFLAKPVERASAAAQATLDAETASKIAIERAKATADNRTKDTRTTNMKEVDALLKARGLVPGTAEYDREYDKTLTKLQEGGFTNTTVPQQTNTQVYVGSMMEAAGLDWSETDAQRVQATADALASEAGDPKLASTISRMIVAEASKPENRKKKIEVISSNFRIDSDGNLQMRVK